MKMLFSENTKLLIGYIRKTNGFLYSISLVVALYLTFTSVFSFVALTASGKSSADKLSETQFTIPQIKMMYDNKTYDLSTFVLANNNGEMKKITIPLSYSPEDGSNPPVPLQIGNTVHFQFDKQPARVNAYIIDIEAHPVELYAQRKIGPNDFEIVGPTGIQNFEVHAFFPDGQYTSQYILANITSGASPTVADLNASPGSQDKISDNGYIALSEKQACNNAYRLRTLQISSSSGNNSSSPTALSDGNVNTVWRSRGTDPQTFVKSSLDDNAVGGGSHDGVGHTAISSNKASWLEMDLGADKTVCNIGIAFPNGDKSVNFFKVQTSTDGQHFTDVGAAESYPLDAGGQLFTFSDMPEKARYVRISDIGSMAFKQTEISEVMAAGK